MAKVRMMVKAELIDARGERFVVEREVISNISDNPRFWAGTVRTDLSAITETVSHQFESMWGTPTEPKVIPLDA